MHASSFIAGIIVGAILTFIVISLVIAYNYKPWKP